MSAESRFSRTADRYAEEAARRDWSAVVELCRPEPHDVALDVAAGPGFLSGALLPRVARAVALDESPELLAHAPEGVERVVGDALHMPFADGAFTLITCVNSLHHMPEGSDLLAEIARVLAPGGRLVIKDYLADADPAAAERWDTIERLRDEGHGSLPRWGATAERLAGLGIALEEERDWEATWSSDRWITMADPAPEAAARLRELIGADTFTLTAWQARFRKGA